MFELTEPDDVIRLRGGTSEPEKPTAEAFLDDVETPRTDTLSGFGVADSLVVARIGGRFRLGVLVEREEGQTPLPNEIDDGRAFVRLKDRDVYAIRIQNEADHPIGVDLSVDGVNVFRLSEEWRESGRFVVDARSVATIPGWHLRGDEYSRFLLGTYPESLANALGVPAEKAGAITAVVYAATFEAPLVEAPPELATDPDDGAVIPGAGTRTGASIS